MISVDLVYAGEPQNNSEELVCQGFIWYFLNKHDLFFDVFDQREFGYLILVLSNLLKL